VGDGTVVTLAALREEIRAAANLEQARFAHTFFKTGPGQYAEGDRLNALLWRCEKCALVTVAHDPRELPSIVELPPYVNELECAAVGATIFVMTERVLTDLHRTVVGNRIDLDTSWHERSRQPVVVREELFGVLDHLRITRESPPVMEELDVFGEDLLHGTEVALVERIEQLSVHLIDLFREIVSRLCVCGGGDGKAEQQYDEE